MDAWASHPCPGGTAARTEPAQPCSHGTWFEAGVSGHGIVGWLVPSRPDRRETASQTFWRNESFLLGPPFPDISFPLYFSYFVGRVLPSNLNSSKMSNWLKIFLWLVMKQNILIKDNISHRGWVGEKNVCFVGRMKALIIYSYGVLWQDVFGISWDVFLACLAPQMILLGFSLLG